MRCEPFCPCVPGPITVETTSGADAMATVESPSMWLNKRGSAMFLRTSKINKSINPYTARVYTIQTHVCNLFPIRSRTRELGIVSMLRSGIECHCRLLYGIDWQSLECHLVEGRLALCQASPEKDAVAVIAVDGSSVIMHVDRRHRHECHVPHELGVALSAA
jgi:hypothetical protein